MSILNIPKEIITSYQFYIGVIFGCFICWKFFIKYNIKWREYIDRKEHDNNLTLKDGIYYDKLWNQAFCPICKNPMEVINSNGCYRCLVHGEIKTPDFREQGCKTSTDNLEKLANNLINNHQK